MLHQAPDKAAKNRGKYEWPKIHLFYFALAACGVVAIASFFGFLEWNESALRQNITKLQEINYLRDTGAKIEGLAAKLGVTADPTVANQDNFKALNKAMLNGFKESQTILETTKWLHYMIGAAIVMMIAVACGFTFLVGKAFRKKSIALQNAHETTLKQGQLITSMKKDVSKLNTALSLRMKDLQRAREESVKKGRMEQLGQLTATVAHELRNPLGAVRTSAFLLERKLKDKGLNVEPQLLRISKGVMRCDDIITQLLDFSRSNTLHAVPHNLDRWLASVVAEEAKRLPAVVSVTVELGLEELEVPFDQARLRRAMINLISNASEAMVGLGDDAAKYAVQAPEIIIRSAVADGVVKISVADNGPGIASENLTKIREPLFTTKSFGTGLGIPAIEQIAKQHGGILVIASKEGQGATFTLHLPLRGEVAVAA